MSQFAKFPASGGSGGSVFWKDAAASFATLPSGSSTGELRQTLDTGDIYRWDGASWALLIDVSGVSDHMLDAADAHDASAISFSPTGTIAATDAQAAIAEVSTDIENHTSDAADAHDASAISFTPAGTVASTDVQAAVAEVSGDIEGHILDSSDAHDASAISSVASGNLAATDVQAALNELQSDIDGRELALASRTDVDVATTNTASTIDIGSGSGANVINIGGANSTINITGSVNNQNVTNLNVADKLITVNDGGAVSSGGAAGLEVEEDSTSTAYVKTSADRNSWEIKAPNSNGVASLTPGASSDTVALLAASQVFTNKTIVVSSNTVTTAASGNLAATELNTALSELQSDIDTRLVDELTTKGDILVRGASAEQRLAIGTDGQILTADSAATNGVSWKDPNQGGINYILNPSAEAATTGWAAYADAAGTSPVDGIGGSANITLTRTTTSAELIRGTGSFKIAKDAANRQGQGVSYDFTIDKADKGKALTVAFEYYADSANYLSDDMSVWVYDVTNAAVIRVNATEDFDGDIKATGAVGPEGARKLVGQFYAASNSTSYRLILHVAGTGTTAWNMFFDNVRVGPEAFYNMPIISPWQSYTPTGSWSTNTTYTGRYRRVGDTMEGSIGLTLAGAPTAATLTVNLPSGFTIDTTKLPVATQYGTNVVGNASATNGGSQRLLFPAYNSTTSLVLTYLTSASTASAGNVNATAPVTWASGDVINVTFVIPILEWANSSTAMSTTQANLQTVVALYEANGSSANTSFADAADEFIDYNNKIKDSHSAVTTGASWKFTAPVKGTYSVACQLAWGNTTNLSRTLMFLWKNGAIYRRLQDITGVATTLVGSVDVNLEAGDYIQVSGYQDDSTSAARSIQTGTGLSSISIKRVPDFTTLGVYPVGPDVQVGSAQTTLGTTTSTSFADLSNNLSITFTPLHTATYKISYQAAVSCSAVTRTVHTINNSVGSATKVYLQEAVVNHSVVDTPHPAQVYGFYSLVAGTSYTFKSQGKTDSGTLTVRWDLNDASAGTKMVAEKVGQ